MPGLAAVQGDGRRGTLENVVFAPDLGFHRLAAFALSVACTPGVACSKTDAERPARPGASTSLSAEPRSSRPTPLPPSSAAARSPTAPEPKQPTFPALPADCREPRVAAANAPLTVLKRAAWNWPWVTQTVLAHESRFAFEATELGNSRRVTFHQREVKTNSKGVGRVELIASCTEPATCNELAVVLQNAVPDNHATPYCASKPEPEPELPLSWSALIPPLPVEYAVSGTNSSAVAGPPDVEKACIRWAVCSQQQAPALSTDRGLECLKNPNKFEKERRCASGATCFDVAQCAGQPTREGPEFPLWRDLEEHAVQRQAFWLKGRHLFDPGGGSLGPDSLYASTFGDLETWQKRKPPGRWEIVATSYSADNPVDVGAGVQAMGSASGGWQLQYMRLGSTIFGPTQSASSEGDNMRGLPRFRNDLGKGPELLFDYDADGMPEVGVYQLSSFHTLPSQVVLSVWTVKQGRIVPYEPAGEFPTVGVDDVDADGRPDLLLDSRDEILGPGGCSWTGQSDCMASFHTSMMPDQVAHSLPDGSFSTKDSVAKKASAALSESF